MSAKPRRRRAILLPAVMLLATAACSSLDEPSNSNSAGNNSGDNSSGEEIAGIPTLDELYAGTYSDPPTTSPPGAEGKSVWWISCGQSLPSCAEPAAAAADAAEALGLDFHLADAKLNQGGAFPAAINTAIAAGADIIMNFGLPCELATGPFAAAKEAGILTMGVETPDCSDNPNGGEQLFTVVEQYSEEYGSTNELWQAYGQFSADYLIQRTGGKAKIIMNTDFTGTNTQLLADGFRTEIEDHCPDCEIIDEVEFDPGKLVPNGPWLAAFKASLLQHPDVTAVYFPWDTLMTSAGGAQAIQESGIPDVISFGGQAAPDGLDFLRQGRITALSSARDPVWSAWAAIDTANRALQDAPLVPEGLGFQVVDADHNLPESGNYVPPIDFKKAYLAAWNDGAGTE